MPGCQTVRFRGGFRGVLTATVLDCDLQGFINDIDDWLQVKTDRSSDIDASRVLTQRCGCAIAPLPRLIAVSPCRP